MNDEEQKIIAFVFNRSGKTQLSFSELYLTLSIELNWFTPDDAKTFIKNAIENEIIIKKEDLFGPNFEIDKINIPTGFYPSKDLLQKPKEIKNEDKQKKDKTEDLFEEIINEISKKTKNKKEEIASDIKKIEEEKNITVEVAALLYAKEKNINLEGYFNKIETLFSL